MILVPIKKLSLALEPGGITEPSGKIIKNLASILTKKVWGRAQACAFKKSSTFRKKLKRIPSFYVIGQRKQVVCFIHVDGNV